jgi:altronate hydrolase
LRDEQPPLRLIHPDDDVAVALADLAAGLELQAGERSVVLPGLVERGHKFALRGLPAGSVVRKYGSSIGIATADIAAGAWVHSHNLRSRLAGLAELRWPADRPAPARSPVDAELAGRRFAGYRRPDGRVGTRNEIWIIGTVGCVARTVQRIAAESSQRNAGRADAIVALTHPFGCSQVGGDLERTRAVLAALAAHPNAAAVLIVGLGCESNEARALMAAIPGRDPARLRLLGAQDCADEVASGVALVEELLRVVAADRRESCGLEDLCVGLKCGGSDGFSGLTANPLLGRIADRVTAAGGRAILSEVPELFGAEQQLLERAVDETVFASVAVLLNNFRRYLQAHGEPLHENPSPGNLAGGITTLEEKSLGAVQKGGRAAVTAALRYGERIQKAGLAVLEAPGNDAVSSTAIAAAGANLLLFSTGRGTPLGCPIPTLKIASNSALALRKPSWIDFDAGRLLQGEQEESVVAELLELVLATASGRPACNELNQEREIALWKGGVTL